MTVEVGLFWLILGLFPLKKQVLQKNCASLDARSDLIFFGWNVLLEWSVRGSCWEIGRRTPTKKCPINVRNKHFSDHLPSNYLGSNLVMVEVQFRVCEIYLLTYINNVLSGKKPILFTVEEALLLLTQCIVQLVPRCEMSHSYFRIDHKKYNYVKEAPKKKIIGSTVTYLDGLTISRWCMA